MQKFHSRSHSHLSEIAKTEVRYNDEDHDNESTDEDYKEHILKKDEKDPNHFPPVIWMIVIGEELFWPVYNILHHTNLCPRAMSSVSK